MPYRTPAPPKALQKAKPLHPDWLPLHWYIYIRWLYRFILQHKDTPRIIRIAEARKETYLSIYFEEGVFPVTADDVLQARRRIVERLLFDWLSNPGHSDDCRSVFCSTPCMSRYERLCKFYRSFERAALPPFPK